MAANEHECHAAHRDRSVVERSDPDDAGIDPGADDRGGVADGHRDGVDEPGRVEPVGRDARDPQPCADGAGDLHLRGRRGAFGGEIE